MRTTSKPSCSRPTSRKITCTPPRVELELKQYDQAISTLEEATTPVSNSADHLQPRYRTFNRQALFRSFANFRSGITGGPVDANEELIDGSFYFNYGATAEQAGLVDKAATLLKKSIELDPSKAAQAYNYLGYMWVDRNLNLDEAGSMIRKALEIEPENGAFLDSLGWFYFKKGDFARALTELLHAADLIQSPRPGRLRAHRRHIPVTR